MTAFRTNTEIGEPVRQMAKAREAAKTQFWLLQEKLRVLCIRLAPDPERERAKTALRKAARRAVDKLLR